MAAFPEKKFLLYGEGVLDSKKLVEYDIILMDPPYSDSSIGNLLSQLATTKLVGTGTTLVVTHSPHLTLDSTYPPLKLLKEHRHGDSCIAVYQKEDLA